MGAVDDVGADEDDAPAAAPEIDHQRPARELVLALQPARQQQPALGEDERRGAALVGAARQHGLEGRAGVEEHGGALLHAGGQGRGLHFGAQVGAGADHLGVLGHDVGQRQLELVEGVVAGLGHEDQGLAGLDHLLQALLPRLADAARVFRRRRLAPLLPFLRRLAALDLALGGAGEDQDVEAAGEALGRGVLGAHRLVGHAVLVEDVAQPALGHVVAPVLVEAGLERAQAAEARQRQLLARRGRQRRLGVDGPQQRQRLALAHGEGAGGEVGPVGVAKDRLALGQQLEGGPVGGVVARVQYDVFLEPGEDVLRRRLTLHRRQQGLQRLVDDDRAHAHGQRQRPAGHVIGQLGLGARVLADVGVVLDLEDVLDEGAIGLRQGNDVRALVEQDVAHARRVGQPEHADGGAPQHLHQALGGGRVVLRARDDVGVGRLAVAAGDVLAGDLPGVEQQLALLARRRMQHRQCGLQVVAHQVGQAPPAALPGVGAEDALLVAEALGALDLLGLDVDGGGQAHRRPLEQDARDVVEPGRVVERADPPAGEMAARGHARQPLPLQVVGDARTDEVDAAPDQRVQPRRGRVLVGRDEEAVAGRSHLVLVDDHLRVEVVVERPQDQLRLLQAALEPVAVVVVAGVPMIDIGRLGPFVGGPAHLLVPVGLHDLAVGVDRGKERQDDVAQDVARLPAAGGQQVPQLQRHLRGGDLVGVEVAGDHDHGLAAIGQALGLAGVDLALGEGAGGGLQPVEVAQVGLVGYQRHEQVVAHRGLAQGDDAHAGRRRGQVVEVGADAVIAGQPVVASRLEAQELLGGLQGPGAGGQGGDEEDDGQGSFHGAS